MRRCTSPARRHLLRDRTLTRTPIRTLPPTLTLNPNPDPHPNPNQVHKALRAATCSETGLSLPALARETGVSIARFERLVEAVAAADGDRRG